MTMKNRIMNSPAIAILFLRKALHALRQGPETFSEGMAELSFRCVVICGIASLLPVADARIDCCIQQIHNQIDDNEYKSDDQNPD